MQIQLIRSATLRFNYAQKNFIIDPYFAPKHTRPSLTGASPNPLVDLPCSPLDVIIGEALVAIIDLFILWRRWQEAKRLLIESLAATEMR